MHVFYFILAQPPDTKEHQPEGHTRGPVFKVKGYCCNEQ